MLPKNEKSKMGQAETKIFENAPAWHENDVLATTDFEEEVELFMKKP